MNTETKTSNVIAALEFTKFDEPVKVEIQVKHGGQGMQYVVFSSLKKETCGHRSCRRHGRWLHDKSLKLPVKLLSDLIAAMKLIQPSSMFEGKCRSSHVFKELYFTDHSEPKRLGVGAGYGQRTMKEIYFELSGKEKCKKQSCGDGLWAWEKEISISSDVLPELFEALHKINRSVNRG